MKVGTRGFRQTVRIAILLGVASAAALANQSPKLFSRAVTPLCYCNCEKMSGAKKCIKICELPQYESRWWAVSCHKKISKETLPSAPQDNSGSRKTNRREQVEF
jgi:hypothetical protein